VLARALQTSAAWTSRAFLREAIALRPAYVEAQRDLAQLIWMRSGDAQAALRRLDKAIRAAPRQAALHLVRSVVLEYAGRSCRRAGGRGDRTHAAPATMERCCNRLRAWRQKAARHNVRSILRSVRSRLRQARLPRGRIFVRRCSRQAASMRRQRSSLRFCGAAAQPVHACNAGDRVRLQADTRYNAWYDYGALVVAQTLDVPAGYTHLDAFLDELARSWEACIGFTLIRCNSRCAAAASCTCKRRARAPN